MNMKKKIISMFVTLFATVSLVQAQNDVTQFLGIPVDGSKSEMMQKLKAKGFTNSPVNKDALIGQFNGTNVDIHIVTNNNKVCRIMVCDVNTMNEGDIKIRFNKLCQQFQNNKKICQHRYQTTHYLMMKIYLMVCRLIINDMKPFIINCQQL